MPLNRLSARLDQLELHLGLRPQELKPGPPFYGHTPGSGLHRLKDKWAQVEYMVPQIEWLCDELELALTATHQAAPNRNNRGFRLASRIDWKRPANILERQLEWDIYQVWGLGRLVAPLDQHFIRWLVGFQVPVYGAQAKRGWDKIDLVGLDADGNPIVFELKHGDAEDKPLRVLLEATAYAIALKANWEAFYAELSELSRKRNLALSVIQHPKIFRVCPIAPTKYWNNLFDNLPMDCWMNLLQLSNRLGKCGFPVSFIGIGDNSTLNEINVAARLQQ